MQTHLLSRKLPQWLEIAAPAICFGFWATFGAQAGSATWSANPTSGDWNAAANWMPATVPNSPTDTATFDLSNITTVSVSADTEVNGIVFNPGANGFTITTPDEATTLRVDGAGIVNNSGIEQKFGRETAPYSYFLFYGPIGDSVAVTGGFSIYSTAGSNHFVLPGGAFPTLIGGEFASADTATFDVSADLDFYSGATAADATFTLNADATHYGQVAFSDYSTAENASFTLAGTDNSDPNFRTHLIFGGTSTAGNASITCNGGITNGGRVSFWDRSSGGTAKINLVGNGQLDISNHFTTPVMAIGSLVGTGLVYLGQFNLSIGADSRSTIFSGILQDGGEFGGTGGAITKIGSGILTLANANTYTGGTTVENGTLFISNVTGSALGSGPVQTRAGTLAGQGTIAGPVTIGTGHGTGAVLAPSGRSNTIRSLTIQSPLTIKDDGGYICKLHTGTVQADQVTANGVTIESGARFQLLTVHNKRLTLGLVFTIINNTSISPISGTFPDLPDGTRLTVGRNVYRVTYEGGDGNDLTLTVQ